MKRLARVFRQLRRERRAALIAFGMAGDPSPRATRPLLQALADGGADILELGMPFSDPLADGPTIQAAAQRALRGGTTLRHVLRAVADVRRTSDRPIVLLSYINPLLHLRGAPAARTPLAVACRPFLQAARRAGLDGVVIPDLPVEEARSLRVATRRHGIALIPLAAPTSSMARLRMIARSAQGFVYYVSVTGTTGVRRQLPAEVAASVRRLQRLSRVPVCVGFGIATPAQAQRIARTADGVIVGSAIVARWHATHSPRAVQRFVRSLRRAMERA